MFPFCEDVDLARAGRLHYIPLSTSYTEIYNIHAFFSGGTADALVTVNSTVQGVTQAERLPLDGDRRLRRIARAGRNWKNTIGRQVDMEGEPTYYPSFMPLIRTASSHSICISVVFGICAARSGQP